jgi:hypothetical protein
LRRAKVVRVGEIRRIDAVSVRDGDSGEATVHLVVRTDEAAVRIEIGLLHETGLLAELQSLPGFDAVEYGRALTNNPSDFKEPFGKRFRVLTAPDGAT